MAQKLKVIMVLFIFISIGLVIVLPMQKSNAEPLEIPKAIETVDTKSNGVN